MDFALRPTLCYQASNLVLFKAWINIIRLDDHIVIKLAKVQLAQMSDFPPSYVERG